MWFLTDPSLNISPSSLFPALKNVYFKSLLVLTDLIWLIEISCFIFAAKKKKPSSQKISKTRLKPDN